MRWKPHVTVAAVVENDGRFLMVEECTEAGVVYNQPAGHLEPGESLIEAVVRETLEETAWHIQPTAIVGLHQWAIPQADKTFLRISFTARLLRHEPRRRLDENIQDVLWLTRAEVLDRAGRLRSPMVIKCIDDYLAGRRYPLEMLVRLEEA